MNLFSRLCKPAAVFLAALAQCFSGLLMAADLSSFSVEAELTLSSQFRSRGIMQSNDKPAIQGGFTLTHEKGFYIGNWNSSISWLGDADPGISAPVEMDFFAGYAVALGEQAHLDVGGLQYFYPGSYPAGYTRPYTTEGYVALTYGAVQLKYSHTLSNLFGIPQSKNSQYYELNAKLPLTGLGMELNAHVGRQHVHGFSAASYTDWALGLSKSWGTLTATLQYVDTNADREVYVNSRGRYTGRAAVILSVSQRF